MKIRNIAIGTIVPLAAAASFAVPSHAATLAPHVTKVSTKMVLNSHITLSGSFQLQLLAGPGSTNVASFDLYRFTSLSGTWQFLGHHSGTNTTDEMQQNFGQTQYGMVPYDSGGNSGSEAYSSQFYPDAFDSSDTSTWTVLSGTSQTVSSSKFYGGSAIETLSAGASVQFYNECITFNDATVIATGPTGGIATAYVNGAKQPGTINFWSKKAGYLKVGFKFGTATDTCSTFKFVETKHGNGGGNDMWFDVDVQIYL